MVIKVKGVELYYEVKGRGKPLILVHGNGEDHTIFDKAAEKLSAYYQVYLIDSRGHGQSASAETLEYDVMAEDVLAFMDALNIRKPVYYGFSDGGIIGLLAAIKRTDAFDSMIISGANITPRGVKEMMYRTIQVMHFFTRDAKLKMMLEQPNIPVEDLHRIETPTLVLAGSKDVIREAETLRIYSNIPNARVKILEKEGHGSYIVHSDKVADLILAFTKR